MPLKHIGTDLQGRHRYVRLRYHARSYTLPSDWIASLNANNKGYGSRELLEEHSGPFAGWTKMRGLERDGKQFVVLSRDADDQWAIELELTDDELGEIRALPPEEAWAIAREIDARRDPPVEIDEDH
jgi:hypothetical protein